MNDNEIRQIDLVRKERAEQIDRLKTWFIRFFKYAFLLGLGFGLLNYAWPLIAFAAGTIAKVLAAFFGFAFFICGVVGLFILVFGKNKRVL